MLWRGEQPSKSEWGQVGEKEDGGEGEMVWVNVLWERIELVEVRRWEVR